MTLSDRITHDLANRILAGTPLPCDLRLESLASHYGTSTRPVRTALARLYRDGLVQKMGMGRLRPVASLQRRARGKRMASTYGKARPEGPDLATRVARYLVEKSLRGERSFVREVATAKQFGVSTTMIRELFQRLVGQGALEHVPRRGWRVRPLEQKDLDDFIEAREALERRALQLAWDRLEAERLRTMLAGNGVPCRPGCPARIDNRLHRYFIERAGNRYISDFFERHGSYFDLLFMWEGDDPKAAVETVGQHERILRAVLAGDREGADQALRDHLRYRHPVLTKLFKYAPTANESSRGS